MEQMAKYTDTNMEQLQMALALSKSTNECQEDINELYPSTQKIAENVKLELFGFKINSTDGKPSKALDTQLGKLKKKKSKFRFLTPTLYTRTNEEREKIITNNISQIITTSMDFFQQFEQSSHEENSDFIPFSPSLQEFYAADKNCFHKSQQTINDIETYYVKELDIPICKTIYGSLLKRWDTIPGRESPRRNEIIASEMQEVNKLEELEQKHDHINYLNDSMEKISNDIPLELTHISQDNSSDVFETNGISLCNSGNQKNSTDSKEQCENMIERATEINTFSQLNVDEECNINDNGICHYERFSDSDKYEDADNEVILAFNSDDEEECPDELPKSSDKLSTNDKDSNEHVNTILESTINITKCLTNDQLANNALVKHNSLISNASTMSTEDSICISDEELNYSSINNFVEEKEQQRTLSEIATHEIKHDNKLICIDISQSDSDTEMTTKSENLMPNHKLNNSCINGATDMSTASSKLNLLTQAAKKSFKNKFEISDSDNSDIDNESDFTSVCNEAENVKAILASMFTKCEKKVDEDVICLSDEEEEQHLSVNSSTKENLSDTCHKQHTLVEHQPRMANLDEPEINGKYKHYDNININETGKFYDNDQTLQVINESNDHTLHLDDLLRNSMNAVENNNAEKSFCNYADDNYLGTEPDEFDKMLMKDCLFNKPPEEKLQHPRVKELSKLNSSNNHQTNPKLNEVFNDTALFNDTRLLNDLENGITVFEENECIIEGDNQETEEQTPIENALNTPVSSRYGLSIKIQNITPMPHYEEMSTPQIHEELNKIGVKPLKRRRAVDILTHVYNSTHLPLQHQDIKEENDLPIAKRRKRLEYPEANELTTASVRNLHIELNNQLADSEDLHEIILERKVSKRIASCALPFHIAWHNFLSVNPEIRQSILLYEPLQIETIYAMFKLIGFKYHIQDMIAFLDRKCITIKIQRK